MIDVMKKEHLFLIHSHHIMKGDCSKKEGVTECLSFTCKYIAATVY
ncbi:hypothetical protein CHCC20335_2534 [Bacillus paralicheniformis]|nr:hypothetical protein CHCC20335_2534 [Bacillus paralicheniformis]